MQQSRLGATLERLNQVHHSDPDMVRRGRLLNVILLGFFLAVAAAIIVTLTATLFGTWTFDTLGLLVFMLLGCLFLIAIYIINRRVSPRAAAGFLIIGLLILLAFSDDPKNVVSGRSTLFFVLPIMIASVTMWPAASFPVTALVLVELFLLGLANGVADEGLFFVGVALLLVALLSWLFARSLENALSEVQAANRELDRRVLERTRDLNEALIQVQLEASKTHAILESIADGVVVFDEQGRVSVVNPAISRMLKLPSQELIGYPINQLLSGVISTAGSSDTTQSGPQDSVTRLPNMRLKWGDKIFSISLATIRMEQEGGRGMVAVFRDITREAELERMKNQVVSMVSHELRTPLGAIIGYGEILQERIHGPLTDRQATVIDRLVANAQRLLQLVNDLLDRAQLEAGTMQLHLSTFSPAQLRDELWATVLPLAKAKNLELTTTITSAMPETLSGDPQRVLQVLINLVSNAVKFTEHGAISVKFDRLDAAHWTLRVSDTGSGIAPEDQPQIFDLFQTADGSATRRHGGAGLGLTIVKQLVTLMGGTIDVTSVVGQGSTFTVTLPLNLTGEAQRD